MLIAASGDDAPSSIHAAGELPVVELCLALHTRCTGVDLVTTTITFAALPYAAIDDQRLAESDLKVLCAVALHDRFGKNGQACWATRDKLAEETGFNATNVSTTLSKLAKLGYLKTSARGSDGRKKSYSVIYGTPLRFAKIPSRAISDRRLTRTLFRTLAVICAHDGGKEKGCFATVSTLAKRAGLNTKIIEHGIAELVTAGYVFVSASPVSPARKAIYISAWRQNDKPPHEAACGFKKTAHSEFDFDEAVRERLPYGVLRNSSRLPTDGLGFIKVNALVKPIYCSEDLTTKNSAEAEAWERKISDENPFNEAVKAMEDFGIDQVTGWRILQELPDNQRDLFMTKACEGALTSSDVAKARKQVSVGHLN